jgi:hypothetical protein
MSERNATGRREDAKIEQVGVRAACRRPSPASSASVAAHFKPQKPSRLRVFLLHPHSYEVAQ